MPEKVIRELHAPIQGMLWSQSRRIPVSLPDVYWLAPGTKDVCIVALTPSTSSFGVVCATIRQALRHGIADTSLELSPAERTIVGVAPVGVRSVSIQKSPESKTNVSVRRSGLFTLRDSVAEGPERFLLRYH
jgi:hypothetical protein